MSWELDEAFAFPKPGGRQGRDEPHLPPALTGHNIYDAGHQAELYASNFDFCDWCPGPDGTAPVADIESLGRFDVPKKSKDPHACAKAGCTVAPGNRHLCTSEVHVAQGEGEEVETEAGDSAGPSSGKKNGKGRKGRDPVKRREQVREASKRFRERRKNRIDYLEREVERLQGELDKTSQDQIRMSGVLEVVVGEDKVQNALSTPPEESFHHQVLKAKKEFEHVKIRCMPVMIQLSREIDEVFDADDTNATDLVRERELPLSRLILEIEYAEDRFMVAVRDICSRAAAEIVARIGGDVPVQKPYSEGINLGVEVAHQLITKDNDLLFLPSIIYRVATFPLMQLMNGACPAPLLQRIGSERVQLIREIVGESKRLLEERLEDQYLRGSVAVPAIVDLLTSIRRRVLDQLRADEKRELILWGCYGVDALRKLRPVSEEHTFA